MKNNEKKIILILIIITAIVIGLTYLTKKTKTNENKETTNIVEEEFVSVSEDGTKYNISTKLKEEKNLEGLKIGNIRLTEKEGQCRLIADVTNTTSSDVKAFLIDIILYDKEGQKIATIQGMISPVKAGQTVQLNAGITENYANAYDFEIIKK